MMPNTSAGPLHKSGTIIFAMMPQFANSLSNQDDGGSTLSCQAASFELGDWYGFSSLVIGAL